MAEIKRQRGQVIIDYMARDYDSFLRAMREQIPLKLPEWTDNQSEGDAGNVLLQLFAHMGDILSYYQDRVANESYLSTAQTRRSAIDHLKLIGYRMGTPIPASASLTLYFPSDCSELVTIQRGDAFATRSSKVSPSVRFEYTAESPLVINCSQLDVVDDRKPVVISVEEGQLVKDEILGTSDGTPNQRFSLLHSGIILRSTGAGQVTSRDLIVLSELGGTVTEWTLQESLAFSRDGQTDYTIEIDENDRAVLIFGDNEFGTIPAAGSVISATYRVGGGSQGNVAALSIDTISDAPQLSLLAVEVSNQEPATGGAERESISHAIQHAPKVFRSLNRAVTQDDFEALALEFGGVGKVRAEGGTWNNVTLYVAPEGGGLVSDLLRANLLSYFEDKRPISTLIEIKSVDYLEIFVRARVEVGSYYDQNLIVEQVEAAAGELLAFENVDFGQPLYLSKFYEAIESIEGVTSVFIPEFRSQNAPPDTIEEGGRILPDSDEVPIPATAYNGQIQVEASGGY